MPYDPNLIVTFDNRGEVMRDLRMRDWPMHVVSAASIVDLANMYHAGRLGYSAADVMRATSDAVATILQHMGRMAQPVAPVPAAPPLSHYRTPLVIQIASLGHAIMLVGPAGCGKTTIGEHVAAALDLQFYITNAINDTHELMGFVDGYGKYHSTPFRIAFERGGVWIADEIDAWDGSVLLAANSALANGFASFPDSQKPVVRHPDFRMVATANTFGSGADRVYVGRNELDAASLDRFAVLTVDYDLTLERMFAGQHDRWLERVWNVRKSVMDKKIRHVVSSRAISMGAAALSAGIDWDVCEDIYLFKGLSKSDRGKVA